MTLRNYNVSEEALLAGVSGSVTAGYAACATLPHTGYVLATTANRAALPNGWISGVFVSSGVPGGNAAIVNAGHVDAAYVPGLASTNGGVGAYVKVQADASLSRTDVIGSDTIAEYEDDGGCHVNLGLQRSGGFTGNATQIQGQPVNNTGIRGQTLTPYSSAVRWRIAKELNFREWFANDAAYAAADGTDQTTNFQEFVTEVQRAAGFKRGVIDANGGPNGFLISDMLHDDTTVPSAHEWIIEGHPARKAYGVRPHLRFQVPCPTGTAASIISYYSGTGNATQTYSLGTYGVDYSGVRILASEADKWIGQIFQVGAGPAALESCGEFYVVGIPANDQVRISNTRPGATGTDANNGAIPWTLYRPGWDIRSSGTIDGLLIYTGTGEFGPQIAISQPFWSGAGQVSHPSVRNCTFAGESTKISRYGVMIGKDIVPRAGNSSYAGVNGNGDLQVQNALQVDIGIIEYCVFTGMDEIDIAHSSTSGQSKDWRIRHNTFNPSARGGVLSGIAYGIPRVKYASGLWNPDGAPHARLEDNWPNSKDINYIVSGSGGSQVLGTGIDEASARWILAFPGTGIPFPYHVRDVMINSNTARHPSKEIMRFEGEGPVVLQNVFIQQNDNSGGHIVHFPGTRIACMSVLGCVFNGKPGHVGRRARLTATKPDPYPFVSGDDLQIKVQGGATRTLKITANNLAKIRALYGGVATYSISKCKSWMVGRVIQGAPRVVSATYDTGAVMRTATGDAAGVVYLTTTAGNSSNASNATVEAALPTIVGNTYNESANGTGGTAVWTCVEGFVGWGEFDTSPPSIESMTNGASSQIQVVGGTMNNRLGFSTGATFGQAQTQLCIDTQGLLDVKPGTGSGTEPGAYELFMAGNICHSFPTPGTLYTLPVGFKRYGTSPATYSPICTASGGTFTAATTGNSNAVTLAGSSITIAGGAVTTGAGPYVITINDPRATADSLPRLEPTNAAAFTLMNGGYRLTSRAAGSFAYTFTNAPAGTETFLYSIQEPS